MPRFFKRTRCCLAGWLRTTSETSEQEGGMPANFCFNNAIGRLRAKKTGKRAAAARPTPTAGESATNGQDIGRQTNSNQPARPGEEQYLSNPQAHLGQLHLQTQGYREHQQQQQRRPQQPYREQHRTLANPPIFAPLRAFESDESEPERRSTASSCLTLPRETVVVELGARRSLGISIVGYSDRNGCDRGIFVRKVRAGSPADLCGRIEPGDMIMRVNGVDLERMANKTALDLMKREITKGGRLFLVLTGYWNLHDHDEDVAVTSYVNMDEYAPSRMLADMSLTGVRRGSLQRRRRSGVNSGQLALNYDVATLPRRRPVGSRRWEEEEEEEEGRRESHPGGPGYPSSQRPEVRTGAERGPAVLHGLSVADWRNQLDAEELSEARNLSWLTPGLSDLESGRDLHGRRGQATRGRPPPPAPHRGEHRRRPRSQPIVGTPL